ncbi:hypothetical protein K0U00_49740, partial [Paenibacillus sepulcri]|nr:hypothetical protein [Paenibacillus sepulcri]
DALSDAAVPYLYAVGYDASDPSAMMKIDAVPAGWNNFKPYSLQVPVTSGHVTVGVNLNGAAGAWGDVDDFYFGLPTSTDAQTQAQPVTASIGDAALPAEAALPVPSKVTLSSGTEGAVI